MQVRECVACASGSAETISVRTSARVRVGVGVGVRVGVRVAIRVRVRAVALLRLIDQVELVEQDLVRLG